MPGSAVRALGTDEGISCKALGGVDEAVIVVDVDEAVAVELRDQLECFSDGHCFGVLDLGAEAVDDGAIHVLSSSQ